MAFKLYLNYKSLNSDQKCNVQKHKCLGVFLDFFCLKVLVFFRYFA